MLIEALYESTYETKMESVVKAIREAVVALDKGYAVSEVMDFTADDFDWRFTVKPNSDSSDDDLLDVSLQIAEEVAYEGEGEGVNFGLDLVWWGGEIAGGMTPYNYTDECWVRDEESIAARFQYFESPDLPGEVAAFIDGLMAKRGA